MKKITIAIDGYSSCGKSTMAKDLAREVGYIYIDSGAMYRAVTLYCLDNGLCTPEGIDTARLEAAMPHIRISFRLNPETGRPMTHLNDVNVEDRIRTMEVSAMVSPVAALGFVREALVKQQQQMGMMNLMMPLMSVYIAFVVPAGLGLYWIISNVLTAVQEPILTAYYKNKAKKAGEEK